MILRKPSSVTKRQMKCLSRSVKETGLRTTILMPCLIKNLPKIKSSRIVSVSFKVLLMATMFVFLLTVRLDLVKLSPFKVMKRTLV